MSGTDETTVGEAMLLTSELLVNAFEHAYGPVALGLSLDPDTHRLRIEVTDTVATDPRVCGGRPDEPYRFGLQIVDRLAHLWGSSPNPPGKTVWAELRLAEEAPDRR